MNKLKNKKILFGLVSILCFATAGIITAGETISDEIVITPVPNTSASVSTSGTITTSASAIYLASCTPSFGESYSSNFIHFPKRADSIKPNSAKIYGCFINTGTTNVIGNFSDYKFQLSKDNLFGDEKTFTQVLTKSLIVNGIIEIPVSGLDEKSTYFYRFCKEGYGCTSRQAFVTAIYDPYSVENISKYNTQEEDLSRFSRGDKRYYWNGIFLGTDYNTYLAYERAYKEGRYVNGKIIGDSNYVTTTQNGTSKADTKSYAEMKEATRKIFDKNYALDEEDDVIPVKKQIVYVYNNKPKKVIQNYESEIEYAQNIVAIPRVNTNNTVNTQTVNGVTYENASRNTQMRDITFELIKDENLNKNKSYQNIHVTASSNNSFFPTTTEGWLIVILLLIGILLAFRAGLESRAIKM